MKMFLRHIGKFFAVALCMFVLTTFAEARATIQIINLDGPGEGFNDPHRSPLSVEIPRQRSERRGFMLSTMRRVFGRSNSTPT